jgi:hypothetical protein
MEYKVKATHINLGTSNLKCKATRSSALVFLKPHQVAIIDDALSSLGGYGEVRLVVENGRLRYLVMQKSYDVMKLDAQVLKEGLPDKGNG